MKVKNLPNDTYSGEEVEVGAQYNNGEDELFINKVWPDAADYILNSNNFLTIRESDDIWVYDEEKKFYIKNGKSLIEETAEHIILKCTRKSVTEITSKIKRSTFVFASDLFESDVINTLDGIIDPDTFEVIDHTPYKYSTNKLPFNLKNERYNLKLYNHIMSIIDPDDIHLFLELIWMYITRSNPFKKMFIFKGDTNTQKTTMSTIISWIIGFENFSYERPKIFLSSNQGRFASSKFIGKRGNIASEIGNFTVENIENQKSLVGGEIQHAEKKRDNTPYLFDPTKFTFLYTTNDLGKAYAEINDSSIIGRYQFMIFRNRLDGEALDGNWFKEFFEDDEDRQSSIDTIVKFVINYKKAQALGFQPKTKWNTISETKLILEEELSIEDKYFKEGTLVKVYGERVEMSEIIDNFEEYSNTTITTQAMGHILKKNGYKTTQTNGKTILKGFTFRKIENETLD